MLKGVIWNIILPCIGACLILDLNLTSHSKNSEIMYKLNEYLKEHYGTWSLFMYKSFSYVFLKCIHTDFKESSVLFL